MEKKPGMSSINAVDLLPWSALGEPQSLEGPPGPAHNPWLNDDAIFTLSVWWVRMTHGETADFAMHVSEVFQSLHRDLHAN